MSNIISKLTNRSSTASTIYKEAWEKDGFKTVGQDAGRKISAPVQRAIDTENQERTEKSIEVLQKESDREIKDRTIKAARTYSPEIDNDAQTKTMNISEVENFTPLVFDPEIISLRKQTAPVLDLLPEEGQEGFTAVYNVVDSRDDPIGYTSESDAVDLSNNTSSDIQFQKQEEDMQIYVDKVNISDFTQEAAAHYMNVEDTTLQEKMAQHMQRKAQQIFYGDPTQDTQTGFIGDASGFRGLTSFAGDAGNVVDKSGVTSGFVKDIKSVVRDIRQDENANVDNLVIMTSHEFYDVLENEADFDNLTTDAGTDTLNVGLSDGGLSIGGVPVVPTHNIDSFTDSGNGTTYNAGDPGDVFIMSSRTARFRALMPLSMIPLAKDGLSESVALAEYGALVEKSQGNFVRHLQAYDF